MIEGLTIQFVGANEAAAVRDVMRAAFAEYVTSLAVRPSALDETIEDVANSIRRRGALIAVCDGQAVGSARFELHADHIYIGNGARLARA